MKNVVDNKEKEQIDEIKLEDVIDLDFLQKFQDNFAKSMNMSSVSVDANGTPVTIPSNHMEFCTYTRSTDEGLRRCEECDKNGGEEASRTGRPSVYKCHAGLIDFGAPIMIGKKQIGSILGGQVLTQPINEEEIMKVAEEIGVDKKRYVETVRKINIVEKERIDAAAELLFIVANSISEMGYKQYKLKKMSGELSDKCSQVYSVMEEMSQSVSNIFQNQNTLNEEIENIEELSKKINEILGLIKKIANQTKILGLNASIESSRAGEFGKGFGVVANEISKLSDSSKETADKIGQLISNIQNSISKTTGISSSIISTTELQTNAVEETTVSVEKVLQLSQRLNKLANGGK